VHFKSKEIDRLMPFGQFWHANLLNGAVIVNQDESETWTLIQTLPADQDLNAALEALEPRSFIYQCLGGLGKPYQIKVDEVIVKYKWKADVAIAESFRSDKRRVFLAGDAGNVNDYPCCVGRLTRRHSTSAHSSRWPWDEFWYSGCL
jgi:FAD-dependent monooxygenase